MPRVVPYINFVDRSQGAVAYYKTVFGGDADVQQDGDRVSHFEFRAGDLYFMGADHDHKQAEFTTVSVYTLVLDCDSEAQLREFYAKLRNDDVEKLPPSDSGWGAVIAQCTDPFGISWLLNFDPPQS